MAGSLEQVLDAHRKATLDADMPKLMACYADDAILVTPEGAFEGKRIIKGDTRLLEWSSESDAGSIPQGADTYIIRDGKIQRQTVWYGSSQ